MSRQGAQREPAVPTGGTPVWVWIVYSLGIFATAIFVISALLVAGAYLLSDDVPVTFDVSAAGIVVWGGLIVLAAGTWLVRRRGGAR